MVDSISSNMAMPLSSVADAASTQRPEPAVQVTRTESARNDGNATSLQQESHNSAEGSFEEINAAMRAWDTGMRFEIDEDTQKLVVSVIDNETGDVLRQIPSEEVLHIAKIVAQFQGKFIDVKA